MTKERCKIDNAILISVAIGRKACPECMARINYPAKYKKYYNK